MVFDASGSRMAWTLIEQLQGEQAYGMGEAGGQAGAGLGHCLGAEQWETSHDCLGASASPALPSLLTVFIRLLNTTNNDKLRYE